MFKAGEQGSLGNYEFQLNLIPRLRLRFYLDPDR